MAPLGIRRVENGERSLIGPLFRRGKSRAARELNSAVRFFALGLTTAAFFVLLGPSAVSAEPGVAFPQAIQRKEPNSRIVRDPDGRQIAEIRWQPGMAGPVGILRVPVGYLWRGVAMLNATFGPDYPDPNVVQPSMQGFILEALLPDFEPMTPQNTSRFKDSYLDETIQISINVAPPVNRRGRSAIDDNFRGQLKNEGPRSTNGLLFKAPFERKPDRFGLQRMGPVSDNFEQFRIFGFVNDIYFPADDPKEDCLVCFAEEIHDVSNDPSWPRRPTCEHHYYSPTLGAIIQPTYRRTWLKNWPVVQAGVEQLFKSFKFVKLAEGFDGRCAGRIVFLKPSDARVPSKLQPVINIDGS